MNEREENLNTEAGDVKESAKSTNVQNERASRDAEYSENAQPQRRKRMRISEVNAMDRPQNARYRNPYSDNPRNQRSPYEYGDDRRSSYPPRDNYSKDPYSNDNMDPRDARNNRYRYNERRPYDDNRSRDRYDTGGYDRFPRRNNRPGGYEDQPYFNDRPSYPQRQYTDRRPPYENRGERGSYGPRPYYDQNREERGYDPEQRKNYRERYNTERDQYHQMNEGRTNNRYPRPSYGGNNRPYGQQGKPRYSNRPDNRDGGHLFNGPRGGNKNFKGKPQQRFTPRPKPIVYKDERIDSDEPVRLNKFLANSGVCSRREADEKIQAGLVKVNGEVITELGTKINYSDNVEVDGKEVKLENKVYILLNKPRNCVTTSDDPQERLTVLHLVRNACKERVYPVGRLDRNTTGVLLLTNDGDLASKLVHPSFKKKKIYHVWLDKEVAIEDMQKLADGIELDDGEMHADAVSYASEEDHTQVGIEIHSGRNRIVRRLFETLGYHVRKLDRVYFAGLTKKNVGRGKWRYLTQEEVDMLKMGAFE